MRLSLALLLATVAIALCAASPTSAMQPPLWADGFNATLIKIGPDSFPNDLQFTKLWYTNQSSRFDFYTSYIGLDQQWHCNFTILFTPVEYEGQTYPMIYHIYPDGGPGPLKSTTNGVPPQPTCYIRANNIPNISPTWLSSFEYMSTQMLRGVPVQWWQEPTDSSLNYFNRMDDITTPVRSTNQANDPGATDYSDYMTGQQDASWFVVPSYCPPPVSAPNIAALNDDNDWIDVLPSPFHQHVRRSLPSNAPAPPVLSDSWSQLGGSSPNLGYSSGAVYANAGGSTKVVYETAIAGQQCEQGPVFLGAPRNSFWTLCWVYDAAGGQNASVFEIAAVDGTILNQILLTDFTGSSAGPQTSTPAIYTPASGGSAVIFVQTNVEIRAIFLNTQTGEIKQETLAMKNTTICGESLTIDQNAAVLFVNSDYDVFAYDIPTFSSSSAPMWHFAYTHAHPPFLGTCTTSGTAVDAAENVLVYTVACNGWGLEAVALNSQTSEELWTTFWPITAINPISSTPVIYSGNVYISLPPYGMAVLSEQSGKILTNGSYTLTSASGTSPSYWYNAKSATSYMLYECQSDDGISSTYELCVTDLSGNLLQPWSYAAVVQCHNQSVLTSYPQSTQTFVTSNNIAVTSAMSTYDQVSCVQAFDLNTGKTILNYQSGALSNGGLVYGTPLVDTNSTIYFLAATNNFQATLTALQAVQGEEQSQQQQKPIARERTKITLSEA